MCSPLREYTRISLCMTIQAEHLTLGEFREQLILRVPGTGSSNVEQLGVRVDVIRCQATTFSLWAGDTTSLSETIDDDPILLLGQPFRGLSQSCVLLGEHRRRPREGITMGRVRFERTSVPL